MTMRQMLWLIAFLTLTAPAMAQDDDSDLRGGLDRLGEGGRMLLEGLMDEMRPMLDGMQPFLEEEVMPMLNRLGEIVDDLSHYDLPERLPNGDIILRRSPDAPPVAPDDLPEIGESGEVEL
jgi:hypothetical protein